MKNETISGEGQVKKSMKLLPKDINYRPFHEASKERLEKVYRNSPNKNARGKNNLYLS